MKTMIDESRLEIVRKKCGFVSRICLDIDDNSGGVLDYGGGILTFRLFPC